LLQLNRCAARPDELARARSVRRASPVLSKPPSKMPVEPRVRFAAVAAGVAEPAGFAGTNTSRLPRRHRAAVAADRALQKPLSRFPRHAAFVLPIDFR